MVYGLMARLRPLAVLLGVVGVSLSVLAGAASAETFKVKSTTELVEAVGKANANKQANTIVLAPGVYLPEGTLKFTDTSGLQTVEGPSGAPNVKLEAAKLEGGAVEPFPSELFSVNTGVSVQFANVVISHGGGAGVAAVADQGTIDIEGSTLGNTGPSVLVQSGATATVRNSTISDGLDAGLIDDGTASVFNSTIAFNKTGGIENVGTLSLTNTIVAQNGGSGDCTGKTPTSDHSLDSDGSCGVGALSKKNPLLQTGLLNDGGSTLLHSLKPGSPAIAAGNSATCTATDQRGATRAKPCSIGADEFNATAPTIKVPSNITTPATSGEGAVVTYTATATSSDDVVRTFVCTPASGATFLDGTTTVTCTATDGHENTASATFKVTVTCPATGFCSTFTHLEPTEPFGEPNGVAIDSNGNSWVTDSGHNHVLEFNSKHEFIRVVGSAGSGSGQFKSIGGVAADASGDVYVVDQGNDRIEEYSSNGTLLSTFGSSAPGNGQLIAPYGIAVDSSGDVWVLNAGFTAPEGGHVVEFSSSGAFISQFGSRGTGPGQLLIATGLAFSGGNLYISEAAPQRVQEFTTSGTFIRQFDLPGVAPGQSQLPYGIASDPNTGNLFVSDAAANRVQEFNPEGGFIQSFGSFGSGAGQLSYPEAVAVDSHSAVFVADTRNKRIGVWYPH
jgi:sugar lactone lactonase YvrE